MRKSIEKQLNTLDDELKLLMRDLKRFSDSDLNWQPKPGSWSVLQVMQHLMKAEDMSLKYVQKKLSFNPNLKNAGLPSAIRSGFVSFYLKTPFKVKAPQLVSEETFPEKSTFWDIVKQWNKQREELRIFLGELPDELFNKALYKHPLGGRMSLGGMLNFYIQHFRRHRKQITKVLQNFKY